MSKINKARNEAKKAQELYRKSKTNLEELEITLKLTEDDVKYYYEEYVNKVKDYFYIKHKVNKNDIIICDGKDFQFVDFCELSTDPIIRHRLKSGKFSKKTYRLDLYNWETKTKEKL